MPNPNKSAVSRPRWLPVDRREFESTRDAHAFIQEQRAAGYIVRARRHVTAPTKTKPRRVFTRVHVYARPLPTE